MEVVLVPGLQMTCLAVEAMKTIDWLNRLYQEVLADLILEEVEVHHNLAVASRNFHLHPTVQVAVVLPFQVEVEEAYSIHDHLHDHLHDHHHDHLNVVFHLFLEEGVERDLPKNCRTPQEAAVEPLLDLPSKAWVVLVLPQTSLIHLQKYCYAKLACLLWDWEVEVLRPVQPSETCTLHPWRIWVLHSNFPFCPYNLWQCVRCPRKKNK